MGGRDEKGGRESGCSCNVGVGEEVTDWDAHGICDAGRGGVLGVNGSYCEGLSIRPRTLDYIGWPRAQCGALSCCGNVSSFFSDFSFLKAFPRNEPRSRFALCLALPSSPSPSHPRHPSSLLLYAIDVVSYFVSSFALI